LNSEGPIETLSLNAGRKIFVKHDGNGNVRAVYAKYGRDSWDKFQFTRLPDGTFFDSNGDYHIYGEAKNKLYAVMKDLVEQIEANGLAAAIKHFGRKSICCICGANLTDPESIHRGIGPECVKKIQAQRIMRLLFG